MRREWNFTLTVRHEAARATIEYLPHWTTQFIDPDRIENLNKLDRDVKHCPMMPFFEYTDLTPARHWEELQKRVRVFYSHVPPGMTLKAYCKRSVQYVLSDPRVVEVDGSSDLKRLRIGQKLNCSKKLGGLPSFQFWYQFVDKADLRNDSMYAIGTIVGQRGYLVLVGCARQTELDAYISKMLIPHFCNSKKVVLDAEVKYDPASYITLVEQLDRYGELLYVDKDACVSFSLPMHAMRIRPDFSPTQTVGVGSITCMTLEIDVYQKLVDEGVEAEITGMPKYKVNNAVLFLDVEDVARMGYPSIMSIDQYSQEKLKRLLTTFKDAKLVGTPISLTVGKRAGRSQAVTFTYDAMNTVVKAMMVSTLVGNSGVTALFFIKLGQGLFDAHLYLFQHLLKTISFNVERPQAKAFSRFNAVNIRLTDQDLPRAYTAAPVNDRRQMEKHLKCLQYSNDGRADGAVVVNCVSATLTKERLEELEAATSGAAASSAEVVTAVEPQPDEGTFPDDESLVSVTSIEHLAQINAWDAEDVKQTSNVPSGIRDGSVGPGEQQDPLVSPAVLSAAAPTPLSKSADGVKTAPEDDESGDSEERTSPVTMPDEASPSSAARPLEQPEVKDLVERLLRADEDVYFGPSLRDVYMRCCDIQRCRPNSYLLKKLPDNPRFKSSIEELDLTSNYVGHNGFVAILTLLEHLPQLRTVYFNDMSLDNQDVAALTEILCKSVSITAVFLRNNVKITLPAVKHFTRLLKTNRNITTLSLEGTKLGDSLISKLEADAKANLQFQASSATHSAQQ
jgi:hypothetical protein